MLRKWVSGAAPGSRGPPEDRDSVPSRAAIAKTFFTRVLDVPPFGGFGAPSKTTRIKREKLQMLTTAFAGTDSEEGSLAPWWLLGSAARAFYSASANAAWGGWDDDAHPNTIP